jgi:hypothetical protein
MPYPQMDSGAGGVAGLYWGPRSHLGPKKVM